MKIWSKAVVGMVFLASQAGAASTPTEDLAERKSSIQDVYKKVARVYTQPLNTVNSFMTGAHLFGPPDVRKKWKVHASLGGGQSTTQVDKSGATAQVASTDQFYKDLIQNGLPNSFDIPLILLNVHLGLPAFLFLEASELGVHLSTMPGGGADPNGNEVKFTTVGIELRGDVLEPSPGRRASLSVGVGLDNNNSSLHLRSGAIAVNETVTSGAASFYRSGSFKRGQNMDLQNTALSVRGIFGYDLLPSPRFTLRPYCGAAAQMNSGITEMRIFDTGSVTSRGPLPSTASVTSTELVEGKDTQPVPGLDLRLGVGLEVALWKFYMAYGFEYGAISGGTGGNFQLGVAF